MFCPKAWKNLCLFAGSLLFYLYGVKDTPWYLALFLVSIIVNYRMSFWIDGSLEPVQKKRRLAAGVIFNLSILAVFKFTHRLPLGISFYTFQAVGWLIDVYREGRMQDANFVKFGTFMTLFPHVISGPILRWKDTSRDLSRKNRGLDALENGLRELTIGLGMKVLLANQMADLWEKIRAVGYESISTPLAWLGIVAFSFEIYFDFYGYSLMAIGLGEMFGFHLPKNFQYPYMATSMTDFWRRWHMSLGTWFRDYVYIPLGGSRVSLPRHLFNIFLVWMLTGFWHGAAWNFVIWGLYFALLLILEKIWLLEILKKSHVLNRIYVLTAAVISFVIFDATDMSQAFSYLKAMFGTGGYPLTSAASSYYFRSYFVVLMIALLGATPIPKSFCRRIQQWKTGTAVMLFAEPLALSALLLICTAFLVDGSFNPFLYFRF